MKTHVIQVPLLAAQSGTCTDASAWIKTMTEQSQLVEQLKKESRRTITLWVVIALMCLTPIAFVLLTRNAGYLSGYSTFTLLLFASFVLIGIVGVILLSQLAWVIRNTRSRPVLSNPHDTAKEYFGHLDFNRASSLSYSCLSVNSRRLCGTKDNFCRLWKEAFDEFKRISRNYVERELPDWRYDAKSSYISFSITNVESGSDSAVVDVELYAIQHWSEYNDYEEKRKKTGRFRDPVLFMMKILLVRHDQEWCIEDGLPDAKALKET